jgi:hypothetical protein
VEWSGGEALQNNFDVGHTRGVRYPDRDNSLLPHRPSLLDLLAWSLPVMAPPETGMGTGARRDFFLRPS